MYMKIYTAKALPFVKEEMVNQENTDAVTLVEVLMLIQQFCPAVKGEWYGGFESFGEQGARVLIGDTLSDTQMNVKWRVDYAQEGVGYAEDVRKLGGTLYVFACGEHGKTLHGTFELPEEGVTRPYYKA